MNQSMTFDDATKPQVAAANPNHSSWTSANAGSGKTRVLTDRVARLLLAGVPPQRILCLTFTIAAANNMQVRLFKRLGEWSMLPDPLLHHRLVRLGETAETLNPENLQNARTLFARALETPGGLKIQTIHAFCASLLKRFPLEAGVSPNFRQIDNLAARNLQASILDELALERPDIFDPVAGKIPESKMTDFLEKIVRWQDKFEQPVNYQKLWQKFILPDDFGLAGMMDGQPASHDASRVIKRTTVICEEMVQIMIGLVFAKAEMEGLKTLAHALQNDTDSKEAQKRIGPLNKVLQGQKIEASVHELARLFLTGASAKNPFSPNARFPRPTLLKRMGIEFDSWFCGYLKQLQIVRQQIINIRAAEKTLALHEFATQFLSRYDQRKREGALLDFGDLILKTLKLLQDQDSTQWVLYRLDGGIDHVLIDEAQDVSPTHWKIISEIAHEFTAGLGTQERPRTVFAVGDEKQSIYGFLDAAPEKFGTMRDDFRSRHRDASLGFIEESLLFSFRSSKAILNLVDAVFFDCAAPGFAHRVTHRVFNQSLPGRVDLWPFIEAKKNENSEEWYSLDAVAREPKSNVKLARAVANGIADMLENQELLPINDSELGVQARPVQPGDIMILLRKRDNLFYAIIQELKAKGLPVAGADRLKLIEELPIRDLTALLSFLAFHHDSLSLAAVLRSPIIGLCESDLFGLAHDRGKLSLWQSLKKRRKEFPQVVNIISDLIEYAATASPYEILERVLTRHGGRERLIARLGHEIEETMDSYLQQALTYEEEHSASLVGFLNWLTTETEIKRQLNQDVDEIRVMTIHGAKGLESPIIILPDTKYLSPEKPEMIEVSHDDETPLFMVQKERSSKANELALCARRKREAEEDSRLLYVALTRAESWLIVCGEGKIKPNCWYERIKTALRNCKAEDRECAKDSDIHHQKGLRFSTGEWPKIAAAQEIEGESIPALPGWVNTVPTVPEAPLVTLSPSSLGGKEKFEKSSLDVNNKNVGEKARVFGTRLHLLLEHLPGIPHDSRDHAARLIFRLHSHDNISDNEFQDILHAAAILLDEPDLAFLFTDTTIPEAELTATSPTLAGRKLHGFMDRLVVQDNKILVVDYKSNQSVPAKPEDVDEGILRQMGAYLETLTTIFPQHDIQMAILWTRSAQLMLVPDTLCWAALKRASQSLA